MNSSDNETEIYSNKDFWLSQFGSTWLLDSLFLFVISPLALIGFVLNLFSFFILRHKEFNKINIYSYFRAMSISSSLLNLMQATLVTTSTFRYFEFSNSNEAIFYATCIFLPVSNIFLLFGSTLDICLSLDRCSIFVPKLKKFFKYSSKAICLVLFIISILISVPYFFVNKPSYYDAQLDSNTYFRIWYWDITPFATSLVGHILAYAGYFIRDVFFLLIELTFNFLSIVLFRKYFKNKENFFKTNQNFKMKTESPNELDISRQTIEKLYVKEKNITLMVIIMCFFSILNHLMYLLVTLYFYFANDLTGYTLAALVFFISTLKNFSNFGLLYFFNLNFRKCFKAFFKR